MLSTIDNPYNPFEDFVAWQLYDIEHQYNTCSYLGRIAQFSDDMTQQEEDIENERAIDEIIKHDPFGRYIKVTKEDTVT